jgi:hypothetical protein
MESSGAFFLSLLLLWNNQIGTISEGDRVEVRNYGRNNITSRMIFEELRKTSSDDFAFNPLCNIQGKTPL